jgi:putative DNA primase/helicase
MSDEQPPQPDDTPLPDDSDAPPPPLRIVEDGESAHEDFVVVPWLPKSLGGACKVLRDPALLALTLKADRLQFNQLTEHIEADRKPVLEADMIRWREACELHIRGTTQDGKHRLIQFAAETARDAFACVAHEDSYHPVREYLNSREWDPSMPSVIEMLSRKALHQTEELPKALFRMFCIGAVARALDPGCKHDHFLVLIGDEACNKSQAVKALCDPWVSDTDLDLDDPKRALSMLNKFWVHEIAELKSFKGKKGHAIKQFLSSPTDNFIPFGGGKGQMEKHQERSCVFLGTSNDRTPLSDTSGNRRTHPMMIQKPIDLAKLRRFKDELWGEAVHAYRAGEQWWPNSDQAAELRGKHEHLMEEDPWQEAISGWLENRPPIDDDKPISTPLILAAIGVTTAKQDRAGQMRVAGILKQLGYQQQPVRRIDGLLQRSWAKVATKVETDKLP